MTENPAPSFHSQNSSGMANPMRPFGPRPCAGSRALLPDRPIPVPGLEDGKITTTPGPRRTDDDSVVMFARHSPG